jgi:hypothetical protein
VPSSGVDELVVIITAAFSARMFASMTKLRSRTPSTSQLLAPVFVNVRLPPTSGGNALTHWLRMPVRLAPGTRDRFGSVHSVVGLAGGSRELYALNSPPRSNLGGASHTPL